jgi:hypothetical protein
MAALRERSSTTKITLCRLAFWRETSDSMFSGIMEQMHQAMKSIT